jgi:hypothetical protein
MRDTYYCHTFAFDGGRSIFLALSPGLPNGYYQNACSLGWVRAEYEEAVAHFRATAGEPTNPEPHVTGDLHRSLVRTGL